MQGGVEVLNGFSGFGESGVELRAVGKRRDFFQFAFAERARDVAAYQLPQRFEFEDFSACLQGSSRKMKPSYGSRLLYLARLRKAFSITPRVPSVISRSFRPSGFTHSTRQTSSPAHSVPPVT